MTFKTEPRVRETSTTAGQGTYTLDGAPVGYQAFSSLGANNYCPYFTTDGTNWEEGIGKVLTGPARLERTHVLDSSNAGAAVDWGAGTRTLRCGPVAQLALPRHLSKDVAGGAGTTVLTQDEQRRQMLEFTGALTGNRVIEVDDTPWPWIVYNNTTGSFTLTVKVTGQAGVLVPQGRRAMLMGDGVDVRAAAAMAAGVTSEFPSGTPMLFAQTSAPAGWTKSATHNDKALRVVSGAAGSGGATGFTSVFGAGKLTGGTTLSTGQIPSHGHTTNAVREPDSGGGFQMSTGGPVDDFAGATIDNAGGGGAHDHTLSLDLAYVDTIIATKD